MPIGRTGNCNDVPQSVRIALPEAVKKLRDGLIDRRQYQTEIDRIIRDELLPHGFALVVRDEGKGFFRFVIRASVTGEVCEIIESCPD